MDSHTAIVKPPPYVRLRDSTEVERNKPGTDGRAWEPHSDTAQPAASDEGDVEDEQETRRVAEHLRTMALREKSRRKAARDSLTFVMLPTSTSLDLGSTLTTLAKRRSRLNLARTSTASLIGSSSGRLSNSTSTGDLRQLQKQTTKKRRPLMMRQSVSLPVTPTSPVGCPSDNEARRRTTETERVERAERVQSLFVEDCEWTDSIMASPTRLSLENRKSHDVDQSNCQSVKLEQSEQSVMAGTETMTGAATTARRHDSVDTSGSSTPPAHSRPSTTDRKRLAQQLDRISTSSSQQQLLPPLSATSSLSPPSSAASSASPQSAVSHGPFHFLTSLSNSLYHRQSQAQQEPFVKNDIQDKEVEVDEKGVLKVATTTVHDDDDTRTLSGREPYTNTSPLQILPDQQVLEGNEEQEDGGDDEQYPHTTRTVRSIGFLDWIWCGCWVASDDDGGTAGNQTGQTMPE